MVAEEKESKAAEMVKKILTVGVGAIFLTEESLRAMVSDFKIPKELLSGLMESAGKTKNEFFQKLSSDILDRITHRVDPKALLDEILTRYDLDFHVRMSLKPKGRVAPADEKSSASDD